MNEERDTARHGTRLAELAGIDASALWWLRPQPRRLLNLVGHPSAAFGSLGADHVVALVAGAAVWLAAAWIGVGVLAAVGARLPGVTGRACRTMATLTLPAALRRGLIGALGVGLLAGPMPAAFAASAHPSPPVVAASQPARPAKPGPSWPSSTTLRPDRHAPEVAPRHAPEVAPRHDDAVRVRAGDSLWLIAAHRLGGHPRPERVAEYWPRVYAANRSVVGRDPDRLIPGQVLHLPDPRSA